MSVENHSVFEIEYKTKADLAAATAVKKSLEDTTKEAAEAGKTNAEASHKTAEGLKDVGAETDKTADKTKDGKHATEESSEAMGIQEGQARKLREALHLIGPEFGFISEASRFMENPVLAAIGLILVGFSALKEKIAETSKEMDALADEAAKPIGDALGAQATAADEAAEAYRRFAVALNFAADNENNISTATQRRISRYNDEVEMLKKLTEAREKAALAKINLDEQNDAISHEEAAFRRGNLTAQQQREGAQFDRQELVNQIDELKKGLKEAVKEQTAAPQTEETLRKQQQAASSQYHSTVSNQTPLEEHEKARQAELDKTLKEYDDAVAKVGEAQKFDNGDATNTLRLEHAKKSLEKASEKLNEETTARDQAVAAVKSNQAATARLKQKMEDATTNYDKLVKHTQELSTSIAEFNQKIKDATASLKLRDQYQPQIQAAEDQATAAQIGAETARAEQHGAGRNGQPRLYPPSQAQPNSDQDAFGQGREETGPQTDTDAAQAVANARILEANMRGMSPQDQQGHTQELISLVSRMMGLLENPTVSPDQHNDLHQEIDELKRRLDEIEARQRHQR